MRFTLIISFSLAAVFTACSPDKKTDEITAPAFKWIEGKFIYLGEQSGYYYEEWNKSDDNNYTGSGYYLTRDCVDTVFSIKMRLIHEPEKTTMIYHVKGQNNNKETEFTLTKGENNFYVFENPFRDFPSIMQYKMIGDSAIEIVERGFSNNKEKVVEYRLRRMD